MGCDSDKRLKNELILFNLINHMDSNCSHEMDSNERKKFDHFFFQKTVSKSYKESQKGHANSFTTMVRKVTFERAGKYNRKTQNVIIHDMYNEIFSVFKLSSGLKLN